MSLIDFTPRRILIIRLSAIGDIIMASALIPVLRQAYPEAKLAWLTDAVNVDLLKDNPRLDRVFVWPRRRWRGLRQQGQYRQLWGEFAALVKSLREAEFDLILDIQGLLKSGVWAWLASGKARIGLGSREGSQWLMTKTLDAYTETRRIGSEYHKLATALGLLTEPFDMDIQPSAQTCEESRQLLHDQGIAQPFAVLCPFTTRPQKHWFEDRWAALANRLMRERGWQVAMLGGADDQAAAARICAQAPGLVDLAGQTSLIQCAAIIAQAELLVGVDTGLTHLGTAMKTPTLALFGSTRPYLKTGFARSKVLYEALPCSPCKRRPSCDGRFDCMSGHTVDNILKAASQL